MPSFIKFNAVVRHEIRQAVLPGQQDRLLEEPLVADVAPEGFEQRVIIGKIYVRIRSFDDDAVEINVLDQILFVPKMIVKRLPAHTGLCLNIGHGYFAQRFLLA